MNNINVATATIPETRIGDFCGPGTVYSSMDEAVQAACCLSSQHPDGATVYCTTDDVLFESGEAYIVAIDITQRGSGKRWDVPAAPYEPVYTIIRRGK